MYGDGRGVVEMRVKLENEWAFGPRANLRCGRNEGLEKAIMLPFYRDSSLPSS